MKHRVGYNRLGRKPSHRKSLHRNMVTSLFQHERIRTTKAKAQAIRRTAEKMITRAKVDSVHNRRIVAKDLKDKAVLAKLFVDIAPRFKERPGGYTRILKIGFRPGDAAKMVLLELVGELAADGEQKSGRGAAAKKGSDDKGSKSRPAKEKSSAKKVASTKAEAPADETSAAENPEAEIPAVEPIAADDATDASDGKAGEADVETEVVEDTSADAEASEEEK